MRSAFLITLLAGAALGVWRSEKVHSPLDTDVLGDEAAVKEAVLTGVGSGSGIAMDDGSVHICIFSDRAEGLKCTLKSTALNAAEPEKVHIWVVTDNATSVEVAADYLKDTGLTIHTLILDEVVDELITTGYKPVWVWDQYNQSVADNHANWDRSWANENTARPGKWDHSTMHMHPLNHLRFYIPYIKQFSALDRIIFMDDDLIIQGDVRQAWNAKENLTDDKMLVGACEIWKWGDEMGAFEYSGKDSSYSKSSALGQVGRAIEDTYCTDDKKEWCVGKNHWNLLQQLNVEINGKDYLPDSQPEWNFGFTLFDLEKWKELKLTDKYEKWMHANYDHHIFPETSLMYGLGIPFLTYYDHVSCWDDITEPKINLRDGFGYITYPEFVYNGLDTSYLTSGFVLHYDGWLKPWYPQADPIFQIPYLKTMEGKKSKEYKALLLDPETTKQKLENFQGSFLVLSEPRAGSEWFLGVLDQNPDICVSGTSTSEGGRIGFPRDILLPYDKGTQFFDTHQEKMKMGCYFSFLDKWVPKIAAKKDQYCSGAVAEADIEDEFKPVARHFPWLCKWADKHPETTANEAALFEDYLKLVLKADSQAWSCQCPRETKVMGTRLMTDWIGHTFSGKMDLAYDRNQYDNDTFTFDKEIPSVWKTMAKLKPKVIHFTRNIIDELVSRKVAAATKVYHVKTDADEAKMEDKASGITIPAKSLVFEGRRRGEHRQYIIENLKKMAVEVMTLNYEYCVSNMEECVKAAEKFLGASTFDGYNYGLSRKSISKPLSELVQNYGEVIETLISKNMQSFLSSPWLELASKQIEPVIGEKASALVEVSAQDPPALSTLIELGSAFSQHGDQRAIHNMHHAHSKRSDN